MTIMAALVMREESPGIVDLERRFISLGMDLETFSPLFNSAIAVYFPSAKPEVSQNRSIGFFLLYLVLLVNLLWI